MAVQTAALELGIISDAQQNAQKTIREFFHATGVESVWFESPAEGTATAK